MVREALDQDSFYLDCIEILCHSTVQLRLMQRAKFNERNPYT